MFAAPAFISAAAGIANSAMNSSSASKNRQMQWQMFNAQNAFNAQQSQLNFERNRDEWTRQFNLQNAYNDPSAQMQRYANAGINPYTATGMFGNAQNASGGNGSAASAGNFPTGQFYTNPVSDFFSGIQQSMQSNLAILDATKQSSTLGSSIDASNANNMLDANLFGMREETLKSLMQSQQAQQAYQNAYYTLKLKNVPDIVSNEVAQLSAETEVLMNRVEQGIWDAETAKKNYFLLEKSFNARVEDVFLRNGLTKAQAKSTLDMLDISHELARNTIRKTDQEIKESDQRIKSMIAGLVIKNYLAHKQGAVYDSQAALYRYQGIGQLLDNSFKPSKYKAELGFTNAQAAKLRKETDNITPSSYKRYLDKSELPLFSEDFLSSVIGGVYVGIHDVMELFGSALGNLFK